jgi:alpha-galactosidase/6-phospho-beta-glucosidase family protein
MLAISEQMREERRRRNEKIGHFTDGMRQFVEGEKIRAIHKEAEEQQAKVQELQEKAKLKKPSEEHLRIVSALEFQQKVAHWVHSDCRTSARRSSSSRRRSPSSRTK